MRRRNIVIGIVAVLIVILMGAAAILLPRAQAQPPYPIAGRPMPTKSDMNALLPAKVGDFQRGEASPDGADYGDGQSQISITVSIKNSPAEAQASVKAAVSIGSGNRISAVGSDPSYLRAVSGGSARMLYTRGAYLFDVQTTSGEALDKFMNSFPY